MKEIPCSQTNQNVPFKHHFMPSVGNGRGGVGGVNVCRNGTGARVATSYTQRQNSGRGVPAGFEHFNLLQSLQQAGTGERVEEQ